MTQDRNEQTPDEKIKRGVSLYSFQEEYFLRKLTLEECIAKSVSIGALGIETIAEQMMPGFPNLSDAFYDQWHGWVEQYGFIPTAHDMFAETKLYPDRERPLDELVGDLKKDIDHTQRLGATIIRILAATPAEVVTEAAPYAADRGIRLLTEIHAPRRIDSDWFRSHLANAERFPETAGFMPDFGIFVRRFPRIIVDRAIRDGARPEVAAEIADIYEGGTNEGRLVTEAERSDLAPVERDLAWTASRFTWEEPETLAPYMQYCHHVQAKFYEMVDDSTEYSIPYDEVVAAFRRMGFAGYLSSEYEGNRHIQDHEVVDSFEQLRRHHAMLAELLGEKKVETANV